MIGDFSGSVARELLSGQLRLGTEDACGLVSRCGHQALHY
jgi:hypothetical protein